MTCFDEVYLGVKALGVMLLLAALKSYGLVCTLGFVLTEFIVAAIFDSIDLSVASSSLLCLIGVGGLNLDSASKVVSSSLYRIGVGGLSLDSSYFLRQSTMLPCFCSTCPVF